MRLVICDGNRLLCEALGVVLQAHDHEVVAVASSADDCVKAVTTYQPDVCLLDMRIPRPEDGLRTVREIRSHCPGTTVLVLSDLSDRRMCSQARNLGVAGLIGKGRNVNQVTAALDVIIDGEEVFDQIIDGEAVFDQIIDGEAVFDHRPRREPPSTAAPVNLTRREAEVLYRMVAGQDTRRMAGDMNVTVSTLRTYVKNVLAKLGAHSRLEAVALASREPARCCAPHSAVAATWPARTSPFDVAEPRQAGIPR
jgi:two-component system, NarL family, nitrate/nitrite response regulator NarL